MGAHTSLNVFLLNRRDLINIFAIHLMIKVTKNNLIKRSLGWFLLLQIINISIDPTNSRFHKRDHAFLFNEIESFYELISEKVFGNEVPESPDNDIDASSEYQDLYCFSNKFHPVIDFQLSVAHLSYYPNGISIIHSGPNAPPPKQI